MHSGARALRQWTRVGNDDDSMLVQDTIAKLFADDQKVASWVKAYVRRHSKPNGWSRDESIGRELNKRFDFIETLDTQVGFALNEGRDEVERIVKLHFADEE